MIFSLTTFLMGAKKEKPRQPEQEAILDLLILVMHIDGQVDASEQTQVEAFAQRLPWASVAAMKKHIAEVSAKVAAIVKDENQVQTYVLDLKRRLGSSAWVKQAYLAATKMADADGQATAGERDVIARIGHLLAAP